MTIALGGAIFSRKGNTARLVVCCNVPGDREKERKAPFDRMNKSGNDFRYFLLLLLSRKKEGKRMAGARDGVGSDPKVRAPQLDKKKPIFEKNNRNSIRKNTRKTQCLVYLWVFNPNLNPTRKSRTRLHP